MTPIHRTPPLERTLLSIAPMFKNLTYLALVCIALIGCAPSQVSHRQDQCAPKASSNEDCQSGTSTNSNAKNLPATGKGNIDNNSVAQPATSKVDLYSLCSRIKDRLSDLDKERVKAEGALLAASGPNGDKFDLIQANSYYNRINSSIEELIPPYARAGQRVSPEDIARFKRCDRSDF